MRREPDGRPSEALGVVPPFPWGLLGFGAPGTAHTSQEPSEALRSQRKGREPARHGSARFRALRFRALRFRALRFRALRFRAEGAGAGAGGSVYAPLRCRISTARRASSANAAGVTPLSAASFSTSSSSSSVRSTRTCEG